MTKIGPRDGGASKFYYEGPPMVSVVITPKITTSFVPHLPNIASILVIHSGMNVGDLRSEKSHISLRMCRNGRHFSSQVPI